MRGRNPADAVLADDRIGCAELDETADLRLDLVGRPVGPVRPIRPLGRGARGGGHALARSSQAWVSACTKASLSWAPETPYFWSITKKGTPLMP